ncbi:MAG: 2-isopropylmalate synthase [Planctomycetes bacterium]|nr:2-isopropylmalate synthase [Planctomycetota bacterium]
MADKRTITIFDTTLRDGEQSPGASMNLNEKVQFAHALAKLNVDVIEAGFPIASPGDFEAVRGVSEAVAGPIICGLARSLEKDIVRAAEALAPAARRRIHVFCATSEIHRNHKLKKKKEQIIEMSVQAVRLARTFTDDVEFSPEDASRTEWDFLNDVLAAVIEAGATTLNIPDTVGYAIPEQFGALIRNIRDKVPNIDKAVISVHCHNDLGLAVANSLAAVAAGAGQVECTINGIGERAGNASLEEVVMALRTRGDVFDADTGIDTRRIYPTSRLLTSITGLTVQRNKAIVGDNAFAHEAGIHQHGVLAHRETYEIMRPEDVGIPSNKLVLGKHSGHHAFRDRVATLGYVLTDEEMNAAFDQFIALADKKKNVYDEDIEAIIDAQSETAGEVWTLTGLQTIAGDSTTPTATVTLTREGEDRTDAAIGDGPVDAVYSAIQRITGVTVTLSDYQLRALTGGTDAQGEVSVEVVHDGRKFRGRGVHTDVVEASGLAYLAAINRILTVQNGHYRPAQP